MFMRALKPPPSTFESASMGKYAGSPEMVPVLDQTLNDEDIGRIDMALHFG